MWLQLEQPIATINFLGFYKSFRMWWPGTESNRRRQPFQGSEINHLETCSACLQTHAGMWFGPVLDPGYQPERFLDLTGPILDAPFTSLDLHRGFGIPLALTHTRTRSHGVLRFVVARRIWFSYIENRPKPGKWLRSGCVART